MTPYFSEISSWFWNPDIWLPSNVTWVSFKEQKHIQGKYENSGEFAQFSDLWYPIPLSLIVMLVRLLVEHLVFKPLGLWLGIKGNRRSRLQRNEVLEQLYCNTSKPNHEEVEIVVKRTSLSYQQVSRQFCKFVTGDCRCKCKCCSNPTLSKQFVIILFCFCLLFT